MFERDAMGGGNREHAFLLERGLKGDAPDTYSFTRLRLERNGLMIISRMFDDKGVAMLSFPFFPVAVPGASSVNAPKSSAEKSDSQEQHPWHDLFRSG